ncbi:hypothetical protein E2C01_031735 [Portunus trituberculatus]|uniref:Uncharacterized protein n=1 Tax=Portunus trituberculatus TaxID=210409 RepID=A0A5B7ETJ0_PORTR|nr:hypothetical protein [Portunus trituberculatus]
MPFVKWFKVTYYDTQVTLKMHLGGDMGPNMGTTINKIACATNGQKAENDNGQQGTYHAIQS